MEYALIAFASLAASTLTLFSGFGLGTMMLPVFAVFMPLPVAVGATAVVHLTNNLFKLALFGKHADKKTSIAFGLPALVFAVAGGYLLTRLDSQYPYFTYVMGGKVYEMILLKTVMGALIVFFALFDWLPVFKRLAFDSKWLGLGGALSGFFGGLSGHQGALRSAFLIKQGLSKESFVGTGVVLACVVDVSRLFTYGLRGAAADVQAQWPMISTAVVAAIAGALIGKKLFHKVTLDTVQGIVAVLLSLMGLGMIAGVI